MCQLAYGLGLLRTRATIHYWETDLARMAVTIGMIVITPSFANDYPSATRNIS